MADSKTIRRALSDAGIAVSSVRNQTRSTGSYRTISNKVIAGTKYQQIEVWISDAADRSRAVAALREAGARLCRSTDFPVNHDSKQILVRV